MGGGRARRNCDVGLILRTYCARGDSDGGGGGGDEGVISMLLYCVFVAQAYTSLSRSLFFFVSGCDGRAEHNIPAGPRLYAATRDGFQLLVSNFSLTHTQRQR